MKHFVQTALVVAIAATATLTACKTPSATTATPNMNNSSVSSDSRDASLIRALTGDWSILDINGSQVRTSDEADYPYIGFQPDAANPNTVDFYAYNGCNFINGSLIMKGGNVAKGGEFISTMKMCPDATYELAISTALEQMRSFKIQQINNESFLYINNGSGTAIMTLRKHNLGFLDGAWRVTRLDGQEIPASKGMEFVIDLQSKTIHGNTGCNVMNGSLEINMEVENGISFKDMATTRMMCPDIQLEQNLLQTLSEVRSAVPDGSSVAKFLNAGGQPVIILKRLSKDELRSE